MAVFSVDALSDKIRISTLCRTLMRKGILTFDEFEGMVYKSYLMDWIENMPAEEFRKRQWQLFGAIDPENATGWKEQQVGKKEAK